MTIERAELDAIQEQLDRAEAAMTRADESLKRLGDLLDGSTPKPTTPRWLDIARAELGTEEVAGSGNNPRILEYLATTTLGRHGRSRDSTPWCSAFVNWCMERAGLEGTNSAMARSWLGWGVDGPLRPGAVLVFKRGKAPSGHVGLCVRDGSLDGFVWVIGGNQADSVCEKGYPEQMLLGCRWPDTPEVAAYLEGLK